MMSLGSSPVLAAGAFPLLDFRGVAVRAVVAATNAIRRRGDKRVVQGRISMRLSDDTTGDFYDSVIVASALLAECKVLYLEDLQHQQVLEKQLTVINPPIVSDEHG